MINSDMSLIEAITGYQEAAVIAAAHRIGVFDVLRRSPRPVRELAIQLSADRSNLSALLEALVSIGLAERIDNSYAAGPYAAERLGGDGEMSLVVAKEAVFAEAWLHLDKVVLKGRPVMDSWRFQVEANPRRARAFLEALDVLARMGGPAVYELAVLAPGKRVLDVGGGLGTYSRILDEAGSRVTLVDLPRVAAWARDRLNRTGVSVVGIDLFEHASCGVLPGSMDAALVSHLLHDLPERQAVDLLGRVRSALTPGGHVVVNDFAGDGGPGAFGALFDLMMRVETAGAAHSPATLESMLVEAGFVEATRPAFAEPITVLVGRKP